MSAANGNGALPELSEGWEWRPLEEVAEGDGGLFTDGDWILAEDLRSGTDVRLLQLGDIGVGAFLDRSSKWISRRRFDELGCTLVQSGDLLISRMADPIARSCIVPTLPAPLITAVDVTICRVANPEFIPEFVLWALNSVFVTTQAEREASGTTRRRITRKKLGRLLIPKPPVDEQREVVTRINTAREIIGAGQDLLDETRDAADRFARAVVHGALAEHRRVRLGDICDVRSGYGFPKNLQGATEGDLPFAKVGDISATLANGGHVLNSARNFLSVQTAAEQRMRPFPAGTVAMAKIGEAVRLNRRVVLGRDALVDNNVMGWVPDLEQVEPEWLYLVSLPIRLADISQATTVPSVRKSDVVEIEVPLPPLRRQRELLAQVERDIARQQELLAVCDGTSERAKRLGVAVVASALIGGGKRN